MPMRTSSAARLAGWSVKAEFSFSRTVFDRHRATQTHTDHMARSQVAHKSRRLSINEAPRRSGADHKGAQYEVREERFPWGLGAILVLAIVGGIGFWVGSSSVAPVIVPVAAPVAPAPVAPAPVTPIYPAYAPHGGGFPLFPLFFGLIFLVVIFKFVRHAAWGGYQRGGPWSGGGPGGAPRRRRAALGRAVSAAAAHAAGITAATAGTGQASMPTIDGSVPSELATHRPRLGGNSAASDAGPRHASSPWLLEWPRRTADGR